MKSPITACSDISLYGVPSEIKYSRRRGFADHSVGGDRCLVCEFLALKNKNKTAARLQQSGRNWLKRR